MRKGSGGFMDAVIKFRVYDLKYQGYWVLGPGPDPDSYRDAAHRFHY